jgi:hypothetical protein
MLDNDPAPNPAPDPAANPAPNLNGLANENEIVLRISLSTGSFASTLQELERRMSGSPPHTCSDNAGGPIYYCTSNASR